MAALIECLVSKVRASARATGPGLRRREDKHTPRHAFSKISRKPCRVAAYAQFLGTLGLLDEALVFGCGRLRRLDWVWILRHVLARRFLTLSVDDLSRRHKNTNRI